LTPQSRQIGAARTMTFGTNVGPDSPRHGQAAPGERTDDAAPPDRCGGPSGQSADDSVFLLPSEESEVGHVGAGGLEGTWAGRQRAGYPGAAATGVHHIGSDAGSASQRQPGYEPFGQHRGHQRPQYGQPQPWQPQSWQSAGPATYRPSSQPNGLQELGPPDLVSYGYKADQSDARYRAPQQGVPAMLDDARAHPGWAGQPETDQQETDQPEFALYRPSGAEPQASARRARRRDRHRARQRWIRLSIATVLTVVVATVAALGFVRSARPAHPVRTAAMPSYVLAVPKQIGSYARDQPAEQQLGLSHSEQYLTQIDPGHVSGIVAAIYDAGGPASSPDRVAVIAGRLVHSPPADVIKSFTQQETAEANAPEGTAAGPLGGQAACAGKGSSGICIWADRDTVGVLVSATLNASSLARVMLIIRSGVEVPAVAAGSSTSPNG